MQEQVSPPQMKRVLLIDDSSISRQIIGDQLEEWGYEVISEESGRAGIARFEDVAVDVVVSDLLMPDIDGLEVLQRIKDRSSETPVIMLSSYSQIDAVLEAVRLGAFDYVIKDEELDRLHAAIDRAIAHIALLRENRSLLRELHDMNLLLEHKIQERTRQLEEMNRRLTFERSELERTLKALYETQTQLVQAEKMASIGLMTAGIAHEINNPLAFLLPNFSLLEQDCLALAKGEVANRGKVAEEVMQLLHECREGLYRIRDIVKELSLFSRKSTAMVERVNLRTIVKTVFKLFGSQMRSARLRLAIEDIPDIVADPSHLRQVLLNLLINAIHATEDRKDGEILISANEESDGVCVSVTDNGEGIAAEHLGKVFDPFFTTKPVGKGTGIGLAICKQLVEKMGGSIVLQSKREQGTKISIKLRKWTTAAEEPHPAHTTNEMLEVPYREIRPTILVVDDEPSLLSMLRRTLSLHYSVVGEPSGNDSLQWLAQNQLPDIVLCDLIMPGMSGMELYRLASDRYPDLAQRFVFMTGGAVSQEAQEFVECGRYHVAKKPLEIDELVKLIEEALSSAGCPR